MGVADCLISYLYLYSIRAAQVDNGIQSQWVISHLLGVTVCLRIEPPTAAP